MIRVGMEVKSQEAPDGSTSEVIVPTGSTSGSSVMLTGIYITPRNENTPARTIELKDRDSDSVLLKIELPVTNARADKAMVNLFIPGRGIRFPSGIKFTPPATDAYGSLAITYRV